MARHVQRVENYANEALMMGLVNLLWILVVIWVNWGLAAVLLTALLLNHAITLLQRRFEARNNRR